MIILSVMPQSRRESSSRCSTCPSQNLHCPVENTVGYRVELLPQLAELDVEAEFAQDRVDRFDSRVAQETVQDDAAPNIKLIILI